MNKKKATTHEVTTKQLRLTENLRKTLLQFLEGKRYEPMGKTALLKRLNIPKNLTHICAKIIDDLLEEGIIELKKNQLHLKEALVEGVRGILRTHPRGFGFVVPDRPEDSP